MKAKEGQVLDRIERLPRCALCHLPTDIQRLEYPVSFGVLNNEIYIKRDDLTLPVFGGNKARKHEFVFGNLLSQNRKGIVWSSSPISNEFRIVSYFGNKLGREVILVTWTDSDENIRCSPNLSAAIRYGAKIFAYSSQSREQYIFETLAREYSQNGFYVQSVYDEALGAISYVKCGEEINRYMRETDVNFDYIFVCSSGATQVGLEIAKRVFDWNTEIVGINHTYWLDAGSMTTHLNTIWQEALKILKIALDRPQFHNEVNYAVAGLEISKELRNPIPGYGRAGDCILELCTQFEIDVGILLDPFYSGKAFYGMLNFLRRVSDKTALFMHTGGGINLFHRRVHFMKIPLRIRLNNACLKRLNQIVARGRRIKHAVKNN